MSASSRPDLSIIIVNRNTRELLRACLQSIHELPDEITLELIVVDNGSTDGSAELVISCFREAHLIRNEANTGFAYPNNQGLAVSRGRYVMLLNSDTEVQPGALTRLVEFMDARPEVGACGPALFYPDGRRQPSCSSFPSLWLHFCDMTFLDQLFPKSRLFGNMYSWFDHQRTMPVDQPAGAALLVRREVVESVGVLDEQFVIYYNDVDWCYRIRRAGWPIYFVHDARIVHHGGMTTRNENRDMKLTAEMTRNHFDYFAKHFGWHGLFWFRFLTVMGYGLRRVIFFLPDLLARTEASRWRSRFFRGTLRAALTGNPNQFTAN